MVSDDNVNIIPALGRITGGLASSDGSDVREDILEYRDNDGWRKVGTMKKGRQFHATSLIAYDQIKDTCKG